MMVNVIKLNQSILEGIPALIEIPDLEYDDKETEIDFILDLDQIEEE